MIDSFVLLAPIFLLGVIALLGFVGCHFSGRVEPDPPIPGPNLRFTTGDKRVDLEWDAVADATEYHVKRGEVIGVHAGIGLPVIPPATTYADLNLTNGTTYYYVVSAATVAAGEVTAVETEDSNEVEAIPVGPFVTSFVPGTPRAGEEGWFGIAFLVIADGVTIRKLGRAYGPANSGPHDIVIVDESTGQVVGTASVNAASETLDGFKYGDVTPSSVPLQVNGHYFVLSHEAAGGDDFLTQDTVVTTRPEAMVTNAGESLALVAFSTAGGPNHAYGPVNFQY